MLAEETQNQNHDPEASPSWELLKLLPLWFIAIAALIYATGFLAVFSFHESYNLRGLDGGFFKIKYAHVGIMFVAIPVIVGIALFAVLHYKKRAKEAREAGIRLHPFEGPPHYLVVAIVTLFALIFYLFVLFGPPGTFRDAHVQLSLGFSLVVAVAGRRVAERFDAPKHAIHLCVTRSIVIILLAILLVCVIWKFMGNLKEMFLPSGCWYLIFSLLMGWLVWLLAESKRKVSPNRDAMVWQCVKVMILGLVYYLAVLSFGLGVYQYIPAGRGGGDFTTASFVVLQLKPDAKSKSLKLPKWLSADNPNDELKLELIEAGSNSIFVANPWKKIPDKGPEESGPRIWRRGRKNRPTVLQISRDQILSIRHLNESYESWLEEWRREQELGKAGQ